MTLPEHVTSPGGWWHAFPHDRSNCIPVELKLKGGNIFHVFAETLISSARSTQALAEQICTKL